MHPKYSFTSPTLLYSVLNTQNTQIEKTVVVVVELGNSYSSSVSGIEARLWCKTFQCLHQATGSEDGQGELSLFTRRKNSCCTGPLNFPAPRSALWILPSAFPMRDPCTSVRAAPSPRAVSRAGLGAGYFLNCELLCWVRKYFNSCVLQINLWLLPIWFAYYIFHGIYDSQFWPKRPFLSLQCMRSRQSARRFLIRSCSL